MPQLNAIGIVAVRNGANRSASTGCSGSTSRRPRRKAIVDTFLPNGVRFMLDTEDVVRSFRPGLDALRPATRSRIAFECASPAEVDEVYARVVEAGFHGEKEPWDAFWGQRYAQLRTRTASRRPLRRALIERDGRASRAGR